MRRIAIIGALAGVGILILRGRMPNLHERVMAHCEVRADEAVEPTAEAVHDAA